jgi:hypothetical protein
LLGDWLGNSEDIVRKHYDQTTDNHFSRAANDEAKAKQNPKQSEAVLNRSESRKESRSPVYAGANDSPRFAAGHNADGEGFEPPVEFPPQRFSRPPP